MLCCGYLTLGSYHTMSCDYSIDSELFFANNTWSWPHQFNSLVPGIFERKFRWRIFKWMLLVIDGWGISWEIALRWMSLDQTNDKSTMVQLMAWCLVPDGTKPLPEPMFDPDLCPHTTPPGHNDLTHCSLVTPYGNMVLYLHWFRKWLGTV